MKTIGQPTNGMILVTPDIKSRFAEAFEIAKKHKYTVKFLADDLIYVSRKDKGEHDRYLVRFTVAGDNSVWVSCRTIENERCDGCRWKPCCSHIAIAIVRWQKKHGSKSTERRAA